MSLESNDHYTRVRSGIMSTAVRSSVCMGGANDHANPNDGFGSETKEPDGGPVCSSS